jgi:Sugar-transfer associated ATP-grasp
MTQVIDRLAITTLRAVDRRASSMIRNAVKAWRRRARVAAQRKIISQYHKRYCQGLTFPAETVKQAQAFLAKNFSGYADVRWHELYWHITGNLDAAFIPSDIFFTLIEPALNDWGHALVLTDKNLMYDLPLAPYLPEPVLHIVDGDVYLPGFIRIGDDRLGSILGNSREEFIVKPSIMHGGGKDLRVLDGASASSFLKHIVSDRRARQDANWIVQRRLEQCPETASFNPSSVNTLRVVMLRIETGIVHLSTVFRAGRKGMRADNHSAGGIACGTEGGCLRGRGMDNNLCFYDEHPDSGTAFRGELPHSDAALRLCQKMHVSLPWFDLISWDVAIDCHREPRIIEFNVANQELLFHQMTNGPIFGSQGSAALSAVLRRLPTRSRTRSEAQKGRR